MATDIRQKARARFKQGQRDVRPWNTLAGGHLFYMFVMAFSYGGLFALLFTSLDPSLAGFLGFLAGVLVNRFFVAPMIDKVEDKIDDVFNDPSHQYRALHRFGILLLVVAIPTLSYFFIPGADAILMLPYVELVTLPLFMAIAAGVGCSWVKGVSFNHGMGNFDDPTSGQPTQDTLVVSQPESQPTQGLGRPKPFAGARFNFDPQVSRDQFEHLGGVKQFTVYTGRGSGQQGVRVTFASKIGAFDTVLNTRAISVNDIRSQNAEGPISALVDCLKNLPANTRIIFDRHETTPASESFDTLTILPALNSQHKIVPVDPDTPLPYRPGSPYNTVTANNAPSQQPATILTTAEDWLFGKDPLEPGSS